MRALLLCGTLALALAGCAEEVTTPAAGPEEANALGRGKVTYWLTLLHNNDGESELLESSQGLADFGGIARYATLVDRLRAEAMPAGRSCSVAEGDGAEAEDDGKVHCGT